MMKFLVSILLFATAFTIALNTFSPSSLNVLQPLTQQSIVPQGSPLPPGAYVITAYFHDPAYFKIFHKQHTGIDMVPSNYTQSSNQVVLLHTTIDGIAYRYTDSCSGNAVIVINSEYIIYLGHIQTFLINNGQNVHYGDTVATMGESGKLGECVTGAHVHYQIYKKENGIFTIVDPLPYVNDNMSELTATPQSSK